MILSSPRSLRQVLLAALGLLAAACSSPDEQKQRHFAQGNAYVAQKRDDFAVIEYANAVRIDPKFGDARWKLAQTYERMNNIQAAFPEYIRAADALPDNHEAQIKATELLLVARRYEDAKARAAAMLAKNPKDVDALILHANAMARLKDAEGAIKEIEEALKVKPTESRAFTSLGEIHRQSGDTQAAEASFKQAIAVEPESVTAHLAFANFLWSAGRQPEAEQELKESIALEPRNVLANRMLAALYAATNRLPEAEAPLKVVAEVSGAPEAKFELAQYYLSVRREDEATRLLTQLAAGQTTFARAEVMLAAIDYGKGRTKEAHSRIDKLLERAPKDSPALVIKAQWLATEKDLDGALDKAKAAVDADPQSAQAHYTLGIIHSQRREIRDAINAHNEVLRLNPRFVAAQVELSRLNLAGGEGNAALRYAEEAKQTAPTRTDARAMLARTLLSRGDVARAEMEISQLMKGAPNEPVVHALNGRLQMMRNNDAAARAAFSRSLTLAPGNLDAIAGMVALEVKSKQIPAALNRIETALEKEPRNPELLTIASAVYDQAGQKDRAEQALRRAVTADPRFITGYAMLAQRYIRDKRLDEARAEFETMVKRDPKAVGPRTMVGMLLESQGKRDEAKRWYEATIAEVGVAPIAANNLAYMYAEDGVKLDTALQLASSAKKELPDNPQVSDTLGWVYYKKDLAPLAIASLEESVKGLPNNPTVLYHLGMAYAKAGDKVKARDAFDRALKLNPGLADAATARKALGTVSQ